MPLGRRPHQGRRPSRFFRGVHVGATIEQHLHGREVPVRAAIMSAVSSLSMRAFASAPASSKRAVMAVLRAQSFGGVEVRTIDLGIVGRSRALSAPA